MFYYVPWSGGCDSTLVLLDLINKGCLSKDCGITIEDPEIEVIPVSFSCSCIGDKRFNEARMRERFAELHKIGCRVHNRINLVSDLPAVTGNGSNQPFIWLTTLAPILPKEATVVFGFIREDDFWHYSHEFEQAFLALHKLHHWDSSGLRLAFPLEWTHKHEVLDALEIQYSVDLDMLWWCEDNNTRMEPCGKCVPCIRHQEARWKTLKEKTHDVG